MYNNDLTTAEGIHIKYILGKFAMKYQCRLIKLFYP
jgi:hypothetical protein